MIAEEHPGYRELDHSKAAASSAGTKPTEAAATARQLAERGVLTHLGARDLAAGRRAAEVIAGAGPACSVGGDRL